MLQIHRGYVVEFTKIINFILRDKFNKCSYNKTVLNTVTYVYIKKEIMTILEESNLTLDSYDVILFSFETLVALAC